MPVRGRGAAVEDIDGNLFLDFTAGIAVSSTGYAHPRVTAAIERQADDLIHFSASDFYLPDLRPAAAELDAHLADAGPTRAFIGNSGAEAIEAAIKLARFATGRQYLIGFLGGFHGRTYGAVTLTASKSKYHAGFGPLLPGVYHVPFGIEGLDEVESASSSGWCPANEVAAIIVEPIQGEGGYIVPDDDFFPRLRKICDDNGILLIADEVQSGAGRTGKMWAIEHWGVEPDILCTAKGIASGMPSRRRWRRARAHEPGRLGHHGSTFGGNPVSCAAALATIELLEDGLIDNAAARGDQAMAGLRKLRPAPGHDQGRARQGPDDRRPVRLRRHCRGRPVGRVHSAACSCSRPARTSCACRRRSSSTRPRSTLRCGSSARLAAVAADPAERPSRGSSLGRRRGSRRRLTLRRGRRTGGGPWLVERFRILVMSPGSSSG